MENEEMRTQLFERALMEINRWKLHYKHLTIFAEVVQKIEVVNDIAKKELGGFRNQLKKLYVKNK